MLVFCILAAALSAGAATLMLLRARVAGAMALMEDPALAVHRRQISEVEELADRGLLPAEELRAARAEAGRRLLASAKSGRRPIASKTDHPVALGFAAMTPLVGVALYLAVGSPGMPDQPFAGRVAEWRESPAGLTIDKVAAAIAAMRPADGGDAEYFRNLARARLLAGQTGQAEQAARLGLMKAPNDPGLWSLLGSSRLDQGKLTPQAREAFQRALSLDPSDSGGLYYLGRDAIGAGRVDEGLMIWRSLTAGLPEGDGMRTSVEEEAAQVARLGRLPTDADRTLAAGEAAGVNISAMVQGLAARLRAQPNDPEGWARLIRAYAVLGDRAKQEAALVEARRIFAGRPDILKALSQASQAPQ